MTMPFTIRQVQYFVSTAESGRISLAAEQHNISQSAVTIAIRQLEGILGVPLFERQPAGMVLTEAGQYFLAHAYEILTAVNTALDIRHWNSGVGGTLNIAATYTVMAYFLPARLQQFANRYPDIRISLSELPRTEIEAGLAAGSLDLAVLLSSNVRNPRLHVRQLLDSRRQLWLSPAHRLYGQETLTFADIAEEPYIMLTVDEAEDTATGYWRDAGYHPKTILRTSSIEAVRSMVANGSGVAILSDMVYQPWSLERKRIARVPMQPAVPNMGVGLAWAKGRQRRAAEKAFCDFVVQSCLGTT